MGNAILKEAQRGREWAVRSLHLVRKFLVAALLRVPLFGLLAMGGLVLAANGFPPSAAEGSIWSALAGWSLTAVYAAAGLIGGGGIGLVTAAAHTVLAFETEARGALERWQPPRDDSSFPSLSLQQLRERYEQVIEQMYASTLGRIRLPGFLERFVRSRFRQAIVEDFLADCQRRGVTAVGLPELRQWLAAKGLPMVTAPVHAQLRTWRLVLVGGILLLAVLPLGLRVAAG